MADLNIHTFAFSCLFYPIYRYHDVYTFVIRCTTTQHSFEYFAWKCGIDDVSSGQDHHVKALHKEGVNRDRHRKCSCSTLA